MSTADVREGERFGGSGNDFHRDVGFGRPELEPTEVGAVGLECHETAGTTG